MSRRKVEELNEEELKNLFNIHLVYYFFLLILLIMPIISCAYEQEDKRELVRSFNNWETLICRDRLVKKINRLVCRGEYVCKKGFILLYR